MNLIHKTYIPRQGWSHFDAHVAFIEALSKKLVMGEKTGQWEFLAPCYQCSIYALIIDPKAQPHPPSCTVYWWEEQPNNITEFVISFPQWQHPLFDDFTDWVDTLCDVFGLVVEA